MHVDINAYISWKRASQKSNTNNTFVSFYLLEQQEFNPDCYNETERKKGACLAIDSYSAFNRFWKGMCAFCAFDNACILLLNTNITSNFLQKSFNCVCSCLLGYYGFNSSSWRYTDSWGHFFKRIASVSITVHQYRNSVMKLYSCASRERTWGDRGRDRWRGRGGVWGGRG